MSRCKELISAKELQLLCNEDKAVVIDIREQDEYNREHIVYAKCVPLSELSKSKDWLNSLSKNKTIVFHCQSGNRTRQAQGKFSELGIENSCILEHGINGWKKNGGKTVLNQQEPLPIMRQVQIIVGFMIVLGVVLSYVVSPYFNLVSAFFGAGLLFAGISGSCALAKVLMFLPFNKPKQLKWGD
jgi:rhodanese-related sulfurtransferase